MIEASEIQKKVNTYLSSLWASRKPDTLYDPIKYSLSAGGKRIRPTLMMLTYNIYNDEVDSILPIACGLEVYHNYTLLHDDLMDDADIRRGMPTVYKKWNANTAILSGDSMLVLAYQLIAKTPSQKLKPVIDVFTDTALEIGEGQQYDMDFENRTDVSENEYIEMIRLKTSVLLACSMKIGAMLAGASESDANNLYKYGEQVGLAFQLQDDFLDVYGDTKVFGKAIGGDILSNKKTYMLINAFNYANDRQRAELNKWITEKNFDPKEKIAAVTKLYDEIGIDKMAIDKIAYYFNASRKYIDAVNVSEDRKANIKNYVSQMIHRKS
jgi:geranylgeranyl diphosphate synthase type II